MGNILYNGTSYGGGGSGNTDYVELTQVEYDLLPQSERENGKLYFITDGTGGSTGNNYTLTTLWDYINDNNNEIPYAPFTTELHDNINNYDNIIIELVSLNTDIGNVESVWRATNIANVNVSVLNNTYNNNNILYTSYGDRVSRFYIKGRTFQKIVNGSNNINGIVKIYGLRYGVNPEGGTNVIPNPQETPTDVLTTIQINDEIFSIDSGGGGIEYSTDEFDTGMTWTDGKKIYGIVINDWQNVATNEYRVTDFWKHGIDAFVNVGGYILNGNNKYLMPYCAGSNYASVAYNTNMGVLILYSNVGVSQGTIYVYYTKSS